MVTNWADLTVQVDEEGGARSSLEWYLACDIYCIDNDGCLFDACLAALIAAMRNSARSRFAACIGTTDTCTARLPEVNVEDSKLVGSLDGGRGTQLQLRGDFPVSLSFLSYKEFVLTKAALRSLT